MQQGLKILLSGLLFFCMNSLCASNFKVPKSKETLEEKWRRLDAEGEELFMRVSQKRSGYKAFPVQQ